MLYQTRVPITIQQGTVPAVYERLGFTRTGSFDVDGWPGAILVLPL